MSECEEGVVVVPAEGLRRTLRLALSGISLTMLMAAWRMVAMLAGPLPVLSRIRSSWKTTSITQCSRFSIPQWARTATAKAWAERGAEER